KASGYLLAGIVLWHVIYQSQIAMSTGLLEETWTRNLLNLMVTPLREVEYLGGGALFGMVKLVIGVCVMVLGALTLFSFHWWSVAMRLDRAVRLSCGIRGHAPPREVASRSDAAHVAQRALPHALPVVAPWRGLLRSTRACRCTGSW